MKTPKLLEYLSKNEIDSILFDLIQVHIDDNIDYQIEIETLQVANANLECELEVLQDAYDGSLEYISHLKEDNDNLESQVIELEQFLAGLDL